MWAVETEDGKVINERDCLWPDLPEDVRIRRLIYRDRRGLKGDFQGFGLYGFQRFSITFPEGSVPHAGTQLIGVSDDQVTVVEINEVTGHRDKKKFSLAELTYDRGLLRSGIRG